MMFFIVLPLLYLGGNAYIFYRGLQVMSGSPLWVRIVASVLFWLAASSFFVTMMCRNVKMPFCMSHALYEIATGWLVFALYMVLFLLVFDLLRLCHVRFDYGFAVSLVAVVLLLGYGNYRYRHPKINTVHVQLDRLAGEDMTPMKIVAVSDVHLGNGTGKSALRRYVDMINAQNPDLILIAGDLIDNSVVPLYEENMSEELFRLKAPLSIYMVPGNHEYISGIDRSIRFLEDPPIHLLRDLVVTLPGGVQLVGRDDRANGSRASLHDLMARVDRSRPVILLDHQPYNLSESIGEGVDLQISGHTHRGQVWPLNWITDRIFEQSHGYRRWGDTHVYVSSGLSLWGPPFRIGTESEMVVILYGLSESSALLTE